MPLTLATIFCRRLLPRSLLFAAHFIAYAIYAIIAAMIAPHASYAKMLPPPRFSMLY